MVFLLPPPLFSLFPVCGWREIETVISFSFYCLPFAIFSSFLFFFFLFLGGRRDKRTAKSKAWPLFLFPPYCPSPSRSFFQEGRDFSFFFSLLVVGLPFFLFFLKKLEKGTGFWWKFPLLFFP